MAIARDTSSAPGWVTYSGNYTCTGSNRIIFICAQGGPANVDNITGATYNGVALTLLAKLNYGAQRYLYLYYLINPASGSNAWEVTHTGDPDGCCFIASYTGVDQSSFPNVYSTNTSGANSISKSITTTVDNCWLFATMFIQTGITVSEQAGTNILQEQGENGGIYDSNGAKSPAGAYSLGWNFTNTGYASCMIIAAIAPYVAPTGVTKKSFLTMMGVGS